jgi:ubiquinone/menaquinone biosynthesis C-methylase UbiE
MSVFERCPITGRGLNEILSYHDLSLERFIGATVYDLGCGISDLQGDLRRKKVPAKVTGFDRNPTAITWYEGLEEGTKLQAELTDLPAPDESANLVIATYSLPHWSSTVETINAFFRECTRVTAVGGILSIFPVGAHRKEWAVDDPFMRDEAIQKWVTALKSSPSWEPTDNRDSLCLQLVKAQSQSVG